MTALTTDRPASPAWIVPRTAYVHVPFCGHKCGYCDFAVTAGRDHLISPYLRAIPTEAAQLQTTPTDTLFLGGGTPTYLNNAELDHLLHSLPFGRAFLECSIESTPESLTAEKCATFKAYGGTRVSIGVQSFQPPLLKILDRVHGVEQIPRAVQAVREHQLDLSFDLIFAAPGQTLEQWQRDLQSALAYEPEHISTYGLTYEKGTPLWKARQKGRLQAASDDLERDLYETAIDMLTAAGYEHYEVSNFARPGHRCRHNERYWANDAYYGLGPGAAAYVHFERTLNIRDTAQYCDAVSNGRSPVFQRETLPPRERALETLAVQLRRADGIVRNQFKIRTDYELNDLCGDAILGYCAEGLLADDGAKVALTRAGFGVADGIVEALLRAARH
jgi:oxygen-independent coproporphyrinogen III oxidase